MPLIKSSSPKAFSQNVKELLQNGTKKRPMKQILAIAYSEKRKAEREKK